MIYLITGSPGSGKTLHMVSMLANRSDLKNREIYVDGISELDAEKIPHNELPEGCTGANWHEWLPTGAVLVIDECQRYWRPRANGSQVPEAIKAMETHRHKGNDIFLLTQHPRLLDINVRSFVENHKHISKSQLGIRRIFEWQRAANPESKTDVNSALLKPYSLDKKSYNLYKSSEMHTKIKTNRSIAFYLLPPFFLLGFALIAYSVSALLSDDSPFKEKPKVTKSATQQTTQTTQLPDKQENSNNNKNLTDSLSDSMTNKVNQSISGSKNNTASEPVAYNQNQSNHKHDNNQLTEADFEPAIKGQPWTAPAYAHLSGKSQIKSMPYPSFCIKDKKTCNCYTDQATLIEEMSQKACRDIMRKGLYNPYKTAEQIYKRQDGSYSDSNTNRNKESMREAMKVGQSNGSVTTTRVMGAEEVEEAELSKQFFVEYGQ